MTTDLGSKAWYQQEPGTYRRGQFTLIRVQVADSKWVWLCRFDGREFDRAATLTAAKKACE